ncbi:loricrin-like [Tetranychus urticae]|uniref:loricrin-like n=1 Tax=Tetranychus urticae TaxID=32264 RepID=UPI00077BD4CA|nr:loricrin-like [Tetranychus urticae]
MCLSEKPYESPTTYYNNRKSSRRSEVYGGRPRDRGVRYRGGYPESGYGGGFVSHGSGKAFGSGYGGFEASSSSGVGFGYSGGSGVYGSNFNGRGKTKGRGNGAGRGGYKGGNGTRKFPHVTQRKTPTRGRGISTTQQRKMGLVRENDY